MRTLRLATMTITVASALLLGGCVVAPADGVYYGDAYSTYSTPTYGYGYGGYGYNSYPYYGSSSLVIQSSPTYVYGGGRPYYRPGGGYYRPPGGGYNRPGYGHSRPQPSRPGQQLAPGTGSNFGRPSGGGPRPSAPAARPNGGQFGGQFQR